MNNIELAQIACPFCNKLLQVPRGYKGKRVLCIFCSRAFELDPNGTAQNRRKPSQAKPAPWLLVGLGVAMLGLLALVFVLWLGALARVRELRQEVARMGEQLQKANALAAGRSKQPERPQPVQAPPSPPKTVSQGQPQQAPPKQGSERQQPEPVQKNEKPPQIVGNRPPKSEGDTPVKRAAVPAGLKVGTVSLTPGWATFGQVFPKGVASEGLQVGDFPTQTDVKVRWPDGSIRFAVLTCKVSARGDYPIITSAVTKGSFPVLFPKAAVKLNLGGTVFEALLPRTASDDLWLSGPFVREYRWIIIPGAGETRHPFLTVLFDVRAYHDGQTRLDVVVENCQDVKAATKATYAVDVQVDGKVVYHHDELPHRYLTRWRKVIPVGLTVSRVTPDFSLAQQAGALPRYMSTVKDVVNSATGPPFDILQIGNLSNPMGNAGGRTEIGPYPEWTARYVARGNPSQGRYVLANGDLAGSWPIHLRQANKTGFVNIEERPNFLFGREKRGEAKEWPRGDSSADSWGPLRPAPSHTPSLAYVPYLATGDRYYAEEMSFWSAWGLSQSFPETRSFTRGLLFQGQARTLAWQLRNLADAAAYLPESAPVRSYFRAKLESNVRWLEEYAQSHRTPLNACFESFYGAQPEMFLFMTSYLSWSLGHLKEQGFREPEGAQRMASTFILQLFTSSPDYPRAYAYVYEMKVGPKSQYPNVKYFTTMKQLFEANWPAKLRVPTTGRAVGSVQYSAQFRFPLAAAIRLKLPGAQEAFAYNEQVAVPHLAESPAWAVRLP